MTRLAIGVLLWSLVHFIPSLAAEFKKAIVDRYGEYPYKGAFTVLIIICL